MADYEFFLTDDSGRRLDFLKSLAFASYTRSTLGLGTINFGLPFEPFQKKFSTWFKPDWRVDVWRSSGRGVAKRREGVYLLRKPNVYLRDDGVKMLQFYGRSGLDLLFRRSVIQKPGSSYTTKTDYADDMMKEIVRQQMLYGSAVDEDGVVDNTRAYPQNEFLVGGDVSAGPSMTRSFEGKNVISALKDIKAAALQLNLASSSNRRVFFDVFPIDVSYLTTTFDSDIGWEFRTMVDLYGADRTTGKIFSAENENIKSPNYSISHLEEVNTVYVRGNGSGTSEPVEMVQDATRAGASRWNRVEDMISASNETSANGLQNAGYAHIYDKRPVEGFPVTFLDTRGSRNVPQSLYGVDWDLGDLLPVQFAGKQFNVELTTVYVSITESGEETITGRNEVSNA